MLVAPAFLLAQDNQSKGKISGVMFGDFYYNVARDTSFAGASAPSKTAIGGPKDVNGFQFRRIYFTYDYDFSEKFTTRFRLEADQTALSGTKILPVVKDAYLKWNHAIGSSDFIFGIQPTTAFDISEGAWGYRSLEKTIIDLRGAIPSRDFGVALKGKIDDDGTWNYWAMIANSDGNSPNSSKQHRFSLNLLTKPAKSIQIYVNGDYKTQANINDPASTTTPKATVSNNVLTLSGFAGYKDAGLSLGLEAFNQSTQNGYLDALTTPASLTSLSALGVTVFGTFELQPDLALIARYDYYDPNTNSNAKGDARNYIIAGASWMPEKNVSIIPNLQLETYEAPTGGTAPSASVNARVTLYYVFL